MIPSTASGRAAQAGKVAIQHVDAVDHDARIELLELGAVRHRVGIRGSDHDAVRIRSHCISQKRERNLDLLCTCSAQSMSMHDLSMVQQKCHMILILSALRRGLITGKDRVKAFLVSEQTHCRGNTAVWSST